MKRIKEFSTEMFGKVTVDCDLNRNKLVFTCYETYTNDFGEDVITRLHHAEEVDIKTCAEPIVRKVSYSDLVLFYKELKVVSFGYNKIGYDLEIFTGFSRPEIFTFSVNKESRFLKCNENKRLYFQAEKCESFIDVAGEVFCFNPDLYLVR